MISCKYEIREVEVHQIRTDESLRVHKDSKKSRELLAASINEEGMKNPIYVRQMNRNTYVLLDGWERLAIWKDLYPDKPILCCIQIPAEVQSGNLANSITANDRQEAVVINSVRRKVNREKLEDYVWFLHDRKVGYQNIANQIGYSKAWVQQVLNRKKQGTVEKEDRTAKILPAELKRMKTTLTRVKKRLQDRMSAECGDALQIVENFLEQQITIAEAEVAKEDVSPSELPNEEGTRNL